MIACAGADTETERTAIELLLAHRVSGIILTVRDADHSIALDMVDAEAIPHVLVHNLPESTARITVATDPVAAARIVVEASAARGHRYLAAVATPDEPADCRRRRTDALTAVLAALGLPPLQHLERPDLGSMLDRSDAPTVLWSADNLTALAILRDVQALGLTVPDDISIIGGSGTAATLFDPPLTTVAASVAAIGGCAVDSLLAQIGGTELPGSTLLPAVLQTGATLGPIRH